jgi:uncharacterized protein YggE
VTAKHDQHDGGNPARSGAVSDDLADVRAGVRPSAGHRHTRRWVALAAASTVGLAGLALGGVALSGRGRSGALLSSRSAALKAGATITVTGSGTVSGRPDTLGFEIGVHSTAPSASEALADNDALVGGVESTLERRGVPASGMQTSQLDMYANENSKQLITGFSVDDDLSVTTHNVSDAGLVIDAAATKAGNGVQLNSISFSISNESKLLAKARAAAMVNARTEASEVAAGAGLTLGGIVRVTDKENSAPQQPLYGSQLVYAPSAAKVPLEPGSQPINVQVDVVYALEG